MFSWNDLMDCSCTRVQGNTFVKLEELRYCWRFGLAFETRWDVEWAQLWIDWQCADVWVASSCRLRPLGYNLRTSPCFSAQNDHQILMNVIIISLETRFSQPQSILSAVYLFVYSRRRGTISLWSYSQWTTNGGVIDCEPVIRCGPSAFKQKW